MSTTIAKAFGNLEQTTTMKERKRYRQARSNPVPRSQQAQNPTSRADGIDPEVESRGEYAPAPRMRQSEQKQSPARTERSAKPLKKRGQDRRSQADPRAYFSDRNAGRDSGQRRYRSGSAQGHYPEQHSADSTQALHFDESEQHYVDDQYHPQGGYRAPLPHQDRVNQDRAHQDRNYRDYDNRVNQPQPPHTVQSDLHPRRVVKSNGKMLRLPVNRMRSKNMITLDQPRSMLAEQYRAIRMALMSNARRPSADGLRPRSNLLMVTSALAGEGKTYTSTNLALSISMEQDKTVLLVDADSSKGSLSRLLGVPKGTPGLMDVLMDDNLNIEDVILKTDVPRFTIIPRGTPNEYATDLFSSGKMQKLLFELSTRYDNRIVMLDTSPLLMTTEARALANFVDQIPFVVGAENTTHESVEESLSYLSPEKYVGMILNMATKQTRAKYGYY